MTDETMSMPKKAQKDTGNSLASPKIPPPTMMAISMSTTWEVKKTAATETWYPCTVLSLTASPPLCGMLGHRTHFKYA